jgi:hypothetical protein
VELVHQLAAHRPPLTLSQRLELAGFLSWTVRVGALDSIPENGFELESDTLLGPLGVLAAVGIVPRETWTRTAGESAAQMIDRLFPQSQRKITLPPIHSILPKLGR